MKITPVRENWGSWTRIHATTHTTRHLHTCKPIFGKWSLWTCIRHMTPIVFSKGLCGPVPNSVQTWLREIVGVWCQNIKPVSFLFISAFVDGSLESPSKSWKYSTYKSHVTSFTQSHSIHMLMTQHHKQGLIGGLHWGFRIKSEPSDSGMMTLIPRSIYIFLKKWKTLHCHFTVTFWDILGPWKVIEPSWSHNKRNQKCRLTVVTVRLVLVFGIGKSQHWVGAAGQTGAPLGRLAQTPAVPQPHSSLWWSHGLTIHISGLGWSNRETTVWERHLRAEY